MTAKANIQDGTPPPADSTAGRSLQLVGAVPSQRRPRRSSHQPTELPDLGALAREAVVRVLHDATLATAESEAEPAGPAVTDAEAAITAATGNAVGDGARDASGRLAAESVAWRAADASVAAPPEVRTTTLIERLTGSLSCGT